MYHICCPLQLRKTIHVKQSINEREALYDNDGDNDDSASYEMTEVNLTQEKSQ